MSDKVQVGKLITDDAFRDAVHVAIAPVVAVEPMNPGQAIGFVTDGDTEHVGVVARTVGIVDPYLKQQIKKGDRFYMWLFPNTVTSLRHQWTHPAFPMAEAVNVQAKAEAVAWISHFADNNGLSYDELIEAAERWVQYEDYLCEGGRYEGCYVPDEFWNHYEHATGKIVPNSKRDSFFSCSC